MHHIEWKLLYNNIENYKNIEGVYSFIIFFFFKEKLGEERGAGKGMQNGFTCHLKALICNWRHGGAAPLGKSCTIFLVSGTTL